MEWLHAYMHRVPDAIGLTRARTHTSATAGVVALQRVLASHIDVTVGVNHAADIDDAAPYTVCDCTQWCRPIAKTSEQRPHRAAPFNWALPFIGGNSAQCVDFGVCRRACTSHVSAYI